MFGITPEMLEEMGYVPAPYGGWMGYDLDPTHPRVRYCVDCACSQYEIAEEPCFNCGGSTTLDKPGWWPVGGSSMQVKGGDQFSVDEIAVEMAECTSRLKD